MQVPRHRDIRIGTAVSIVLKADQRTGRQVPGTVAQLLTRGDHPRGVKVRLTDGRVGRVQQLVSVPNQAPSAVSNQRYRTMDPEHNPWQSSTSQGNPYLSREQEEQQRSQQQQGGYQSQNQYSQQGQQGQQGHAAGYYQNTNTQNYPQTYERPSQPPPAPAQGLQRSDTDTLLAQQNDGAEQLEYMQNYEASARQTQDDKDQAQLQKEFPNVDSSLIAALYSDTKDLASTREMLQELART